MVHIPKQRSRWTHCCWLVSNLDYVAIVAFLFLFLLILKILLAVGSGPQGSNFISRPMLGTVSRCLALFRLSFNNLAHTPQQCTAISATRPLQSLFSGSRDHETLSECPDRCAVQSLTLHHQDYEILLLGCSPTDPRNKRFNAMASPAFEMSERGLQAQHKNHVSAAHSVY